MVVWARRLDLAALPPLDGPPPSSEGVGLLDVLAVVAVALYALRGLAVRPAVPAARRRRPAQPSRSR